MKKRNRGMSILEVIVVIGIIVALIGLIMPAVHLVKGKTKQSESLSEINQLDTALMAFFTDKGSFPRTTQLMASLSARYFDFDPKRVDSGIYNDHWDNPYLYICPGVISSKGYDLYSLGLLMSQKDSNTLGRIISALSSSIFRSSSESGAATSGLAGKTIWGLSEPEYDMLVLGALRLLRFTDVGFELAVMINISNIVIEWDETLYGTGTLAYYWPYSSGLTRGIYLNPVLLEGPAEALTAIIAHEATHLADHLSSGDMDFDSIEEEYDAFYNGAMVWQELTEGKTFTNLNDQDFVDEHPTYVDNIDFQEENLDLMMQGEEAVKEDLRKRYYEWPEEDQWGDSYVVAKEY